MVVVWGGVEPWAAAGLVTPVAGVVPRGRVMWAGEGVAGLGAGIGLTQDIEALGPGVGADRDELVPLRRRQGRRIKRKRVGDDVDRHAGASGDAEIVETRVIALVGEKDYAIELAHPPWQCPPVRAPEEIEG